jgi:hypothetical protein
MTRAPADPGRGRTRRRPIILGAILLAAAVAAAGCGLNIQSADLFLLTRTGPGGKLTLRVSDGGTIRCNGGHARTISSAQLITARALADSLATDARHNLRLTPAPGSIYRFRIDLEQGVIRFSDRDTPGHPNLARVVLFATQAAQQICGLSG